MVDVVRGLGGLGWNGQVQATRGQGEEEVTFG